MENNKNNKKKPLKLSLSGRLQVRRNLGPSSSNKNQGNKKTIQIVFKNKNNQQKSSSTANLILEDLHLSEHRLLERQAHQVFLKKIILYLSQKKVLNLIIKQLLIQRKINKNDLH